MPSKAEPAFSVQRHPRFKQALSVFGDTFHDMILVVGDRRFNVHRIILSCHSPVLKSIFVNHSGHNEIHFPGENPEIFETALNCFYNIDTADNHYSAINPLSMYMQVFAFASRCESSILEKSELTMFRKYTRSATWVDGELVFTRIHTTWAHKEARKQPTELEDYSKTDETCAHRRNMQAEEFAAALLTYESLSDVEGIQLFKYGLTTILEGSRNYGWLSNPAMKEFLAKYPHWTGDLTQFRVKESQMPKKSQSQTAKKDQQKGKSGGKKKGKQTQGYRPAMYGDHLDSEDVDGASEDHFGDWDHLPEPFSADEAIATRS